MWWHIACEALSKRRCLSITYDGHTRLVEVHAVGTARDGNALVRAFQISSSRPGAVVGFRLVRLDKAWQYSITEEASLAPRSGYQRDDSHIETIRCQI